MSPRRGCVDARLEQLRGLQHTASVSHEHRFVGQEGVADLTQFLAIRAERRQVLDGESHRRGDLVALDEHQRDRSVGDRACAWIHVKRDCDDGRAAGAEPDGRRGDRETGWIGEHHG